MVHSNIEHSRMPVFEDIKVEVTDSGDLEIDFGNGKHSTFSAIWLRYNDRSAKSRDKHSGQRIFHLSDLPTNLRVTEASHSGSKISVTFGGEKYFFATSYDAGWLSEKSTAATGREISRPNEVLGCDEVCELPNAPAVLAAHDYGDALVDEGVQLSLLSDFVNHGYFLLNNLETTAGMGEEMVKKLWSGSVYETNYGRHWAVKVIPSANNLAYTNQPITCHSDNNYRDPTPSIQVLHCMVNKCTSGGETGVCDGFAVADRLRREDPDAFRLLTSIWVPHEFHEKNDQGTKNILRRRQPVISVDDRGNVVKVAFNNRTACAIDANRPAEEVTQFYAAYEKFRLMAEEAVAYTKLSPGDCIVFDNTRMLHARTGFEMGDNEIGHGIVRKLEGMYAHRDQLFNTYMTLKNNSGILLKQL